MLNAHYVVFGFLNNSFTGRERGEAYSVQVGYTKRSDSTEAGTLNFLVTPVAGGTASMFYSNLSMIVKCVM